MEKPPMKELELTKLIEECLALLTLDQQFAHEVHDNRVEIALRNEPPAHMRERYPHVDRIGIEFRPCPDHRELDVFFTDRHGQVRGNRYLNGVSFPLPLVTSSLEQLGREMLHVAVESARNKLAK